MNKEPTHIVLIGAGIMSATLGILLRKLMPDVNISIYERLDKIAAESSDVWNNAGTGHSAFCELNYTPLENGEVDISKALEIASSFEISKELWAYLTEHHFISNEIPFINDIPHMSFVWGKDNVNFLEKRYSSMQKEAIFQDMQFTCDQTQISDWVPLMMDGRVDSELFAATKMDIGTDVNFGLIAQSMIGHLESHEDVEVFLGHEIKDLSQVKDGHWKLEIENLSTEENKEILADYVFIGAGGGSLPLLEKSGIEESLGYGGFPISGEFLRCTNDEVVNQHEAKVYGKAAVGSPPMSVPHLDTRIINGERSLFFGPYAGFTTKFLKNGSYLDLPLSIEVHNVWPILVAGVKNIDLTKYLIKQNAQTREDRFEELLAYYPNAQIDDWELTVAGQRVQIIQKDKDEGGVLKFGTEIVCSADKSISALLGASPGASTSVSVMLEVIEHMFPNEMKTAEWQKAIQEMIPSFGQSILDDASLCMKTRERTTEILNLRKK